VQADQHDYGGNEEQDRKALSARRRDPPLHHGAKDAQRHQGAGRTGASRAGMVREESTEHVPSFQREGMINRPVEEVFDFVADARNEPRYNPRILNVEKTTSGPIGRGTHFVLVSKAMGQRTEVEYELTAYEQPRRMASSTIRGLPLMDVQSTETFEPVGGGTCMRWSWEIKPRGAAGRLITPMLARMLGRRLDTAAANIKRVLEEEASAARMDDRV
jgi:hypothetical protein